MPRLELSYFDESGRVRTFRVPGDSITIGSDASCSLTLDGLPPVACQIYRAEAGYYALEMSGTVAVDGRPGSGYVGDDATLTLENWLSFRVNLVPEPSSHPKTPGRSKSPSVSARSLMPNPGARTHHPGLAVGFGLLAGGGHAYNGRPVKAAVFLLTSVLILPWIWSLVDAHREASRIVAEGGRSGRGGVFWVLLHGWFAVNVALTIAVILTVAGVLT